MRSWTILALLAVWLPASPAYAVPVTWTGEWSIAQRISTIIGVGGAESAFGASATQDGDIKDLTADLGVAKAAANAQSDIDQDSTGNALVEFVRPFTLPASSKHWSVRLFGALSGKMTVRTTDEDITASAFIDAVARVLDNQGDTVFEIGDPLSTWHDALIRSPIANQGPAEKALLEALEETRDLTAGQYFLYGRIEALTGATKSPPGIADSTSQFFNSLVIGITVTPLAEPPTILTAGTLALILAALRRRLPTVASPGRPRDCREGDAA